MSEFVSDESIPIPPPADRQTEAERAGLHDGALGQTWREYKKILEFQAEQRRVEDACTARKQLELLKAELSVAVEDERVIRIEYDQVEEHYRIVASDKDRKPSAYSGLWGVIFVLLAIILVGADFPLTRQIVSAMSIGTDANWTIEQVLVSIGIVAMSLFFKLLTDPFTQPLYMMGQVRRTIMQIISGVLFVGLMGGVVTMLVLLGMFRAGAIGVDAGADEPVTATAPAAPSGVTTTAGPASTIDSRLHALEAFRDQTFVVMSLILPVIGGIFASVGMSRIHNAGRFRYLRRERHRLRFLLDKAMQVSQRIAAAVRGTAHDLAAIENRAILASGEYHQYLHSYQTGVCNPALERPQSGMAARVRHIVEKWTDIVDQTQNLVRTEAVSGDDPNKPSGGDGGDSSPSALVSASPVSSPPAAPAVATESEPREARS